MPTFDISQHVEFGKWLEAGLYDTARRAALATALHVVEVIQTELIPGEDPPPVDQRFYSAAWRAEPTAKGADVYNDIPYASVIEGGARAENVKIGGAMIAALTEWVKRKGLVGKTARSDDGKQKQTVEARQIAWAIAVSMKKKGIFNRDGRKGLGIAKRAMERVPAFFREEFKREIKRQFKG